MARKDDDEDVKPARKTARETEAVAPAPTVISGLPPEDYLTEQEKGPTDPVNPPVEPEKAVLMDIATKQPYPTAEG